MATGKIKDCDRYTCKCHNDIRKCRFPHCMEDNEAEIVKGKVDIKDEHITETFTLLETSDEFKISLPKSEADPNGIDQHAPGAKLDAGKVKPAMVLSGFSHAFWEVAKVGTLGSLKYTEFGFLEVPDGEKRYADASMRHFLKKAMDGEGDEELTELAKQYNIEPDKQVLHLACEAWNKLAELEFYMRSLKNNGK